ncbi:hypothetical protein [Azotobacter salinestris]|uniref:hypothetical protein n=1 Tax=Azotobacter salinestris TaxID=69964 RepID=UPI0032DF87F3
MPSPEKYVSLEMACAAIKRDSIELLRTIAQQLYSILDPSAQFSPTTIYVAENGNHITDIPITYEELAAYLKSATGKYVPVLFETSTLTVESHCVLVNKDWLTRRIAAARESLRTTAAIEAGAANHALRIATHVNGSPASDIADQPAPMGEAGLKNLRHWLAQQNDQRKAYEAASKDALALQQREQEIAELRAKLVVKDAWLEQSRESEEWLRRELIERDRQVTTLTDQLSEHAGIIEFMNPDNPYSPVEGRRLVTAWDELTESGTVDPVTEAGVGIGELVRRWWKDRFGEPPAIVVKHSQWALTWPARKKGGMVARRRPDKG